MKKGKKIVWPILLFLLVLTSCSFKGIEPTEVGKVFADHLIYEKEKEKFMENFKDGKDIEKTIKTSTTQFEKDCIWMFTQIGGSEISTKQAQAFSKNIMKKMKQRTTYDIEKVDAAADGKSAKITYAVKGLDFKTVFQTTMVNLLTQALDDPELVENEDKMTVEALKCFNEAVNASQPKQQAVNVTVTLNKDKAKWYLKKKNEQQVLALYRTFMVGVNDEDVFNQQIQEAIRDGIQEAQAEAELREAERLPQEESEPEIPQDAGDANANTNADDAVPEE